MKKACLFFLIIFLSLAAYSQEFESISPARQMVHDKDISLLSPLEILEDSLVFLADSMYFSSLDESRISGSYEFIRMFKKFLKEPGSFKAPLKKLKEKIAIIEAPDYSFRIYNWEIVRSSVERRYYGSIQTSKEEVIPLVDLSDQIVRGATDSIFSNQRWFGCLYYKIILKEVNGQNLYFLLGWNGNSVNSERKLVEALSFDRSGHAIFGAPLFNIIERGVRKEANRFILEYEKSAKVSLNVDPNSNDIIFDHCESQIGDPAKKFTYIPDGTYDGLQWNGDKWVMKENVIEITILKDGEAPLDKAIIK